MLLSYPDQARRRRHGPRGYERYESYKPWLRDEFDFRCVYCLCRETWCVDGQAAFGVDHVEPVSLAKAATGNYENLVYGCLQCNSLKQDKRLPFHPSEQPLAEHLVVGENGLVTSQTEIGTQFIRVCRLNRPALVEFRRQLLATAAYFKDRTNNGANTLLRNLLRFPTDLPNLRSLKPPNGNTRPEGIAESYYERQQRGELPDTY